MVYLIYGRQGSCSRLVERLFLHAGCRGGLEFFKGHLLGKLRPRRVGSDDSPWVCKWDLGMAGAMRPKLSRLLRCLRRLGEVHWVVLWRPGKFGIDTPVGPPAGLKEVVTVLDVSGLLKEPEVMLKRWGGKLGLDFSGFPETIYDADAKYEKGG
jgi:hypothetical protein